MNTSAISFDYRLAFLELSERVKDLRKVAERDVSPSVLQSAVIRADEHRQTLEAREDDAFAEFEAGEDLDQIELPFVVPPMSPKVDTGD